MLCQSFVGTILTLRYFWQSDYESLCSNVVVAMKWTKSPQLWGHDWQWCKMRNELHISNLSPVFWWILCLFPDNANTATTEAKAQAALTESMHSGMTQSNSVKGSYLNGLLLRINVGNTTGATFQLRIETRNWHSICDMKNYLLCALISFLKNSFIIHSFTHSVATLCLKTVGQILGNGNADMNKIQLHCQRYTHEMYLEIIYLW